MAIVVRGKNHGKEVVLKQWCNDWCADAEANVYKPTNLKFTDDEKIKINESNSGIMFELYEWKGNRLVARSAAKPLTLKEQKFVENMANPATSSPGQAAKNAGYSPKSASVIANENLNKPYIIEAIEQRKAEVAKHSNVTPEQVLGATALRAFATIDDAFDEYGYFDIEKARNTGAIHLVKKIARSQTQHGENVSVEFYSNESAQDKLGSYLGMDKLPAENPNNDVVTQVIERLIRERGWSEHDARQAAQQLYEAPMSEAVN